MPQIIGLAEQAGLPRKAGSKELDGDPAISHGICLESTRLRHFVQSLVTVMQCGTTSAHEPQYGYMDGPLWMCIIT